MTATDDAIRAINIGFYAASRDYWAQLEAYYLGNHPTKMLTEKQRSNPRLRRFWAPINVCNIIVNEPTGYLSSGEVKVRVPGGFESNAPMPLQNMPPPTAAALDTAAQPEGTTAASTAPKQDGEDAKSDTPDAAAAATGKPDLGKGGGTTSPMAEWAVSFIKRRVKPRLAKLLTSMGVFGEGYLYLYVDDTGLNQGIKIRALAPLEEGSDRVYVELSSDEEEISSATVLWRGTSTLSQRVVAHRVTLTPGRILEEMRGTEERTGRELNWKTVSNEVNEYGVVPLVRFVNPTESDLLHILPLQDDLNKSAFDIRLTREFHGFPMLTTQNPQEQSAVEIAPGKLLQGGPYTRLEPGDMSQIIAADGEIMGRIALLSASLLLQEKGGEAPSGLALSYLQQSFRYKVRAKADALEAGYTQLLLIVARMLYASEALYLLEQPTDNAGNPIPREAFGNPRFLVEVVPAEVQDQAAQMQADLAAVAGGAMSIEEFSRRNKIDPYVATKEIEGNMARKMALEAKYAAQPAPATDEPPQNPTPPKPEPAKTGTRIQS